MTFLLTPIRFPMHYILKKLTGQLYGIEEYRLVDPEEKTIEVLTLSRICQLSEEFRQAYFAVGRG